MGIGIKATEQKRPLHLIAAEIRTNWDTMSPHAKPYIDAMACLNLVTDNFGQDSAEGIVRYFLVNAQTWRGEVARRIKTELKAMLK